MKIKGIEFSEETIVKALEKAGISLEEPYHFQAGDVVGSVDGLQVQAKIEGVIRGLLRDGTSVWKGMKTGDIDPRGIKEHCYTISDKARAVGGGVLEGILSHFNR